MKYRRLRNIWISKDFTKPRNFLVLAGYSANWDNWWPVFPYVFCSNYQKSKHLIHSQTQTVGHIQEFIKPPNVMEQGNILVAKPWLAQMTLNTNRTLQMKLFISAKFDLLFRCLNLVIFLSSITLDSKQWKEKIHSLCFN